MATIKVKRILESKAKTNVIIKSSFLATLMWKTSIDLDLHVQASFKEENTSKPGLLTKIFGKSESHTKLEDCHVFFGHKGNLRDYPWISLDKDDGIGDKVEAAGYNEENMRFGDLNKLKYVLVYANIYNKPNSNFSLYDSKIILHADAEEITVPLTSSQPGSYAIVALIDNNGPVTVLNSIDQVLTVPPRLIDFIR